MRRGLFAEVSRLRLIASLFCAVSPVSRSSAASQTGQHFRHACASDAVPAFAVSAACAAAAFFSSATCRIAPKRRRMIFSERHICDYVSLFFIDIYYQIEFSDFLQFHYLIRLRQRRFPPRVMSHDAAADLFTAGVSVRGRPLHFEPHSHADSTFHGKNMNISVDFPRLSARAVSPSPKF